jgi:hypothetical protein
VTLNLHPASGIRAYEEMYERMAVRMGIDPATEATVEFDFTDSKFIQVYFEEIHHVYEQQGVDFWWIDWQQGSHTKIRGLDPLWLLNHFYYLDNGIPATGIGDPEGTKWIAADQMQNKDSYDGFNFSSFWKMDDDAGISSPVLRFKDTKPEKK